MYELPTLNDTRVRAIIGTHPEEFFEVMKELEPYILICISATGIEIKLRNSYVDVEKLEATFKRLNHLGYHPNAHSSIYTMPNGEQVLNLDIITIDWKKKEVKGITMTLKEKKFENYSTLSDLLFRLETIIRNGYNYDLRDMKQFGELMKRPMRFLFIREIDTLFDTFIHFNPGMAENTERGYSITMIAQESENEEDPIKDTIKLNTVEDVFWARNIINKTLLELFPKED